nr:hypothetical protein [Tanacetum cinerariifolium]
VYPTFHYDDDWEMDLFGLIRALNPTKVKTGSRPRAPHELPLLTLTASRVIEMDEPAVATDSSGVPDDVSDPDPLAFAGVAVAEDPGSENASSPIEVLSPGSVYRPEWGVTNGSLLDTPEACQDLVDHAAPSGYFAELRHMPNDEFLRQYNAKLLKKSVAQVARREKRIQDRELEIRNLEVGYRAWAAPCHDEVC